MSPRANVTACGTLFSLFPLQQVRDTALAPAALLFGPASHADTYPKASCRAGTEVYAVFVACSSAVV